MPIVPSSTRRSTQLSELFPDLPAVVVAIVRDGKLIVPRNEDQILEGDDAYLILPTSQVARTLQIFGHEERQARRIIIAGGGNIGLYLAKSSGESCSPMPASKSSSSRAIAPSRSPNSSTASSSCTDRP